jgi:hypothetical protein
MATRTPELGATVRCFKRANSGIRVGMVLPLPVVPPVVVGRTFFSGHWLNTSRSFHCTLLTADTTPKRTNVGAPRPGR